jgi:hypothetical protein
LPPLGGLGNATAALATPVPAATSCFLLKSRGSTNLVEFGVTGGKYDALLLLLLAVDAETESGEFEPELPP